MSLAETPLLLFLQKLVQLWVENAGGSMPGRGTQVHTSDEIDSFDSLEIKRCNKLFN